MHQKTGTLQLPVCVCVCMCVCVCVCLCVPAGVEHLSKTHIPKWTSGHTSGLGVVLYVGTTLIRQEFYFEKKHFKIFLRLRGCCRPSTYKTVSLDLNYKLKHLQHIVFL